MQILYSAGRGPLSDGGYFSWMHGNSIWANDAAKEGDGASVVCIVLSYNEQLILGEMLEDLVNTVYIGFMWRGVDENVGYESNDAFTEHIL